MGTIFIFIFVLGLLIFAHEFGHFVAARLLKVGVQEFGFGFPPRLWGIKRKGTMYSVNWIPIGGFVRLHGDEGESHDARSFLVQRGWKRAVILLSGVVMNVVLAAVIFTVGFASGLPTDVTDGVPAGTRVRDVQIQIVSIAKSSAAESAGLQIGDAIKNIDGTNVTTVNEVQTLIRAAGTNTINIAYVRSKVARTISVPLTTIPGTTTTGLGIGLVKAGIVSFPLHRAVWEGVRVTYTSIVAIVVAFGQLITNLFVHHRVSADVAGPVGIAVLTGQVAQLGFGYLLQFVALLSLNLAIVNILPIPALDGGRLLFLFIEKLRGRPLSEIIEAKIHSIGFAALLSLVAVITLRDVIHLSVVQQLWQRFF